jgi:phage baseplate assembly protein W
MERAIILPFSVDSSGSIFSSNDQRLIWQSRVTSVVMTEVGERVFRPEYGGHIKDSLFQTPQDAANIAAASVKEVFSKYLAALVLNDVTVSMDPQSGLLSLTIDYTLPNKEKAQVSLTTGTITRSGDITQEF